MRRKCRAQKTDLSAIRNLRSNIRFQTAYRITVVSLKQVSGSWDPESMPYSDENWAIRNSWRLFMENVLNGRYRGSLTCRHAMNRKLRGKTGRIQEITFCRAPAMANGLCAIHGGTFGEKRGSIHRANNLGWRAEPKASATLPDGPEKYYAIIYDGEIK